MAAEQGFHTLFAPFAAAMMFGSVGAAVQTYRELATSHGHTDARAKCSYFINVVDSKAEELATKERLRLYLHSVLPAFPSDRASAPPHIAYFADIVERLQSMKAEDFGERSVVTGDPETCINVLKKCEAAGIEEVILYFNFGHFSHRDTLKSMERFAREVMPHF
jgi:alkanesulfonate monooxygenase SsuD/methylene tetrahydromethanopterin reductase-like flavin-dependent oxidoreductase (luciferase family)